MKLAYSYKDKIFWIQNFLSKDQYKSLGDPERWSETHDKEKENSMHEAMKEYLKQQEPKQE